MIDQRQIQKIRDEMVSNPTELLVDASDAYSSSQQPTEPPSGKSAKRSADQTQTSAPADFCNEPRNETMAGFTVTARVYSNGKHEIHVFAGKTAAGRAEFYRRRSAFERPRLEDWQVAEADTIAELRSTIIGAFGLGWFNRARAQISALETA